MTNLDENIEDADWIKWRTNDKIPFSDDATFCADPDIHQQIAAAAAATDPSPSEAEKKAGNYRKGKFTWNGLPVSIETAAGNFRSGKDKNERIWKKRLSHHYGYFGETNGADDMHVDVFVGPYPFSDSVFVIDQLDEDGAFDEHKAMIGFHSRHEAKIAYLMNYDLDWLGLGGITIMPVPAFKAWLENGDMKSPLAALPGLRDTNVAEFDVGVGNPHHQPAGSPTGGQFAPGGRHGEKAPGPGKPQQNGFKERVKQLRVPKAKPVATPVDVAKAQQGTGHYVKKIGGILATAGKSAVKKAGALGTAVAEAFGKGGITGATWQGVKAAYGAAKGRFQWAKENYGISTALVMGGVYLSAWTLSIMNPALMAFPIPSASAVAVGEIIRRTRKGIRRAVNPQVSMFGLDPDQEKQVALMVNLVNMLHYDTCTALGQEYHELPRPLIEEIARAFMEQRPVQLPQQ
jgi:hypothetical protein